MLPTSYRLGPPFCARSEAQSVEIDVLSCYSSSATWKLYVPHASLTPLRDITVLAPIESASQSPFILVWIEKDAMKEATSTRDVSILFVVDISEVVPKTLKITDVYSLLRLIDASLGFLQTHHLKISVGHHLRPEARPWIFIYMGRKAEVDRGL